MSLSAWILAEPVSWGKLLAAEYLAGVAIMVGGHSDTAVPSDGPRAADDRRRGF